MDQNNQKESQKGIIHYHLLWKSPFDVLLNSFVVWISDKEAFRIIQSHHVIKHAVFKQIKDFWPRVETRLLIAFSYLLELLTQAANFEDTKSL